MKFNLISRQIIEGELVLEDESVVINNVKVMYLGEEFKVIELKDNKFMFEITSQFENGNYEVIVNASINGKESNIIGTFVVSNDKLDSSLPIDLQSLA